MRSLPKSFQSKVTTIEESEDLDEIKIQELVGSLQNYELGFPSHKSSKSLALKTINERIGDSSNEDDVEKEVAYLAKNFRKFLKMKNNGKSFGKGKFSFSKGCKRLIIILRDCVLQMQWPWASKERVSKLFEWKG